MRIIENGSIFKFQNSMKSFPNVVVTLLNAPIESLAIKNVYS